MKKFLTLFLAICLSLLFVVNAVASNSWVVYDRGLPVRYHSYSAAQNASTSTTTTVYYTGVSIPVIRESNASGDYYEDYVFWQEVNDEIMAANDFEVVIVDATTHNFMSWTTMETLNRRPYVGLLIYWNGPDIMINAGKGLEIEEGRITYPLSYLAQEYYGAQFEPIVKVIEPKEEPKEEPEKPEPKEEVPVVVPETPPVPEKEQEKQIPYEIIITAMASVIVILLIAIIVISSKKKKVTTL